MARFEKTEPLEQRQSFVKSCEKERMVVELSKKKPLLGNDLELQFLVRGATLVDKRPRPT